MTTWWGEGATNGDAETHEEVPIQEERLGGDEDTIMAFEQQELMDGDNKDDKEENDSEGEKSYD